MLRLFNKLLDNLVPVFGLALFLLLISSVVQAGDVKENKVTGSASNQPVSHFSQDSQSEIDLGAGDYNSAYDKNAKSLLGFAVSGRHGAEMTLDVVDRLGERVGILNDYLLNKEGEIEYAVVIVRDLPVLDDTVIKKFVAIPIDMVLVQDESDVTKEEHQMKLTLTKEQVNQIPEFVFDENDATQTKYNLSVRKLIGMKILGKNKNLLGVLDDLIIRYNRATYALINMSGVLGSSGKLVAVPFKALQINKER